MNSPDDIVPFDLDHCRELELERPVTEVREEDVTEALKTIADNCPELDDKRDFNALAKHLGFGDALALRREVRAQLTRRSEDALTRILRLRVLQGLLPHFDHVPENALIQLEVASIKRDAEDAGQPLTEQQLETMVEPLAHRRVVSAMLFKSLAKALALVPSEDQILAAIERHVAQYQDPDAVRKHLVEDTAAASFVLNELMQELVVEAVLAHAKVVDRPMTQDELIEELEVAALEMTEL